MLGIDHFEQVNDRYGHLAGDAVLAALRGLLRDDLIGRFGGEEFCALLPDTSPAQAGQAAERLRRRFAQLTIPAGRDPGRTPLHVTVSIGVATLSSSQLDLEELIAAADAALYRAKAAGRARVVMSGDPPPQARQPDVSGQPRRPLRRTARGSQSAYQPCIRATGRTMPPEGSYPHRRTPRGGDMRPCDHGGVTRRE